MQTNLKEIPKHAQSIALSFCEVWRKHGLGNYGKHGVILHSWLLPVSGKEMAISYSREGRKRRIWEHHIVYAVDEGKN